MKKKNLILLMIILLVILAILAFIAINRLEANKNAEEHANSIAQTNEVVNNTTTGKKDDDDLEETTDITIVPTLEDEISEDSAWCATFQLVWNEMKNELVGQDVVFNPQLNMVKNLNKEEFTKDMISEDYYYLKWGLKTIDLKEEIEDAIAEKFNQKSDILDKFSWEDEDLNDEDNPDLNRYFFYAMLYREFEFNNEFDVLDNDDFGEYEDVEYFGVDGNSAKVLDNQIDVLYYGSEDDFAVILNTKSDDQVIVAKGVKGKTFGQIYDNIATASGEYEGSTYFEELDTFKMPKLDFNVLKDYEELENEEFETSRGTVCQIAQAMQSIQFTIDEKGGKIKSEAAIDVLEATAAMPVDVLEPRHFDVDDTFVIFLKEADQDVPYFGARINDITKYQK